ncbi:ABC transporter substrate-binding protein [Pseudomonas sp. Irchel 3A5]|uniref:substrate-binding periplasmic protein n=1 Tax=Pseudomonas sp. Irchel 3A5 TaxID=2008911 RepID=UPI000BA2EC4F|nr:transporter substrate-binding domain-containing protein [Pseudomonas sp. Irchel 3A5]
MFLRNLCHGLMLTALALTGAAHAEVYQAGGTQWRPFSYEDEQGNLRGISTDIVRRVLQQANIEAQFVSYPVNRLQAMLGKAELDMNYADSVQWNSPEELQHFVFSEPYLRVKEHLYVLKGSPAGKIPVDKLRGLTIGTVRGYTYLTMDPSFADKRLVELETSEDPALLQLLLAKRVDAIAMVDDLFDYLVAEHRMDPDLFERGASLSDSAISIKLQPELVSLLPGINKAIRAMIESGEVERIRTSYLSSYAALLMPRTEAVTR